MTNAGPDLSGLWTGLYNYPDGGEPCPFDAELRDSSGLLVGVTSEAGNGLGLRDATVHAILEGQRSGTAVGFTKTYDHLDLAPDPVHYEGTLASDGDEIEGRWTIPGIWSGTFLMVRKPGAVMAAETDVDERVRV